MIETLDKRLSAAIERVAPTPRERALLAVLGAAVAVVAVIQAASFAADQIDVAAEAQAERVRAEMAARDVRNPARRAALETAANAVRARAFDDATLAIATVRAQTDVEALARTAGLEDPRVSVLLGDGAERRGQPIRLALDSSFAWGSFDALLGSLKESAQAYAVESVEVDEESGALRMVLRAAYIPQGAPS